MKHEQNPTGIFALPPGYRLLREVDLQKNKKLALWLNLGALVMMVLLLPLGVLWRPFRVQGNLLWLLVAFLLLMAGMILYLVAHELVHGVFIKKYCGRRAQYGFTGLYAFAGQRDAYFSAKAYRNIALAPVVIWGVALAVACALAPGNWFWYFYMIQLTNISGAVGDYYVTWLLHRLPGNVYVNDDGVTMRFYGSDA